MTPTVSSTLHSSIEIKWLAPSVCLTASIQWRTEWGKEGQSPFNIKKDSQHKLQELVKERYRKSRRLEGYKVMMKLNEIK